MAARGWQPLWERGLRGRSCTPAAAAAPEAAVQAARTPRPPASGGLWAERGSARVCGEGSGRGAPPPVPRSGSRRALQPPFVTPTCALS